jgi:uncharacterized protein (DUF305 family)
MLRTRVVPVAGLLCFALLAASVGPPAAAQTAAAQATVPPGVHPADARFMSGMILHHAQAVLMAGWAPTHGADPRVRTLCARIVVSQRDEIALMASWLRRRGLPVPDTAMALPPDTAGMDAHALMPGMLTAEQLAALDRARGAAWDRRFLAAMIRHHEGAITMVNELFGSPGAPADPLVFQFASDVSSGQLAEIARMRQLLAALPADSSGS